MKDEALRMALEKVANALPAYIEGTAAREYLAVIHSALAAPVQIQKSCKLCTHEQRDYLDMTGPCKTCRFYSNFASVTPPAAAAQQAQRKPLTLGQKQKLWSSVGYKPTLKDRVNAYGLAIEAAHGIKE